MGTTCIFTSVRSTPLAHLSGMNSFSTVPPSTRNTATAFIQQSESLFDPPFALSHSGMYFFAIQARPCSGYWDVLFCSDDAYLSGAAWGVIANVM